MLKSLLEIGAFSGIVTLVAAFKADNIDSVIFVWVVRKGGAWGLRGLTGRLGGLLKSMGLLLGKGSSRS